MNIYYETDYLCHHGVKGMKWGIRRYQNADGTLTAEGKKRYVDTDTYRKLGNSTFKAVQTAKRGGPAYARAATKLLNKADQYRAENVYRARETYQKQQAADKRMQKAESKGKVEKAEKYRAKMQDYAAKTNVYQQRAKNGANIVENLLPGLEKDGYSVTSKRYKRSVNRGRNAVKSILASAALGGVVGGAMIASTRTYVPGTKYKVRGK